MTTPPCLASLPVLTHTTGDERIVHAFTAVLPSDGHPGSNLMNNPSAITPSPLKISVTQTHEEHAPGPLYGARPSAQPSRDATITTATIARGPPRHDNSGKITKPWGQTRASFVSINFRCPRLARIELFGEKYSHV